MPSKWWKGLPPAFFPRHFPGLCQCALLIPELMMKVFTNDPELITLGASYLRFMSITYLCWGITEVYLAVLRVSEE